MREEGANAGGNEGGGEGAGETPAWMNSMPDAYKQNEGFAQFGEAADAYARFDELLKADGDALHIPGEDATDEEKNAFAQKMGRPEAADNYTFAKPEAWPDGVAYDEGLESAFKDFAFSQGMSDIKATETYDWYNKLVLAEHDAVIAATEKSVDALKDMWKGDDYKVNSEIASRALFGFAEKTVGAEEAKKFFETATIDGVAVGSHPLIMQIFKEVGASIADDSADAGRGGGGGELSEEQKAQKRFPNTKSDGFGKK